MCPLLLYHAYIYSAERPAARAQSPSNDRLSPLFVPSIYSPPSFVLRNPCLKLEQESSLLIALAFSHPSIAFGAAGSRYPAML
jgi:hypothetical protein